MLLPCMGWMRIGEGAVAWWGLVEAGEVGAERRKECVWVGELVGVTKAKE